jgi:GT2 family glycosyltransferase
MCAPQRSSEPANSATARTMTFVVPVRNDATRLRRCLESIKTNTVADGAIDIVVVDNGSSDGSPDVAHAAGARVLVAPGVRVSELRNRGALLSDAEVLAFVDADHEICAHWVEHALASLRDPSVGAVGALCHPPADGTWVQRTYDLLRAHAPEVRETEWLGAGNLAVRRLAFDRAGGFDGSLEASEDVALCQSVRRAGYRLLANERLVNVHLGDPRTLKELFVGELWRGRNNLGVSLRVRPSLRTVPGILIPILDLTLLGAAVLALFAGGPHRMLGIAMPLIGVFALSLLRMGRMVLRLKQVRRTAIAQAFAVAVVYDFARALALVVRKRHRGVVRPTVIDHVSNQNP